MLHINRAARQEKEKSSQTPRLGMRSYTIDTIETYASATNDTPLPQISMLEERSMDFGCELFSSRTSPPGEENYALVLRNTNIEIWGAGVVRILQKT